MPLPRIVDRLPHDPYAERAALVASLRATPASIPPKYFYDALGCALFGAICALDEYYPTRTEQAIFEHYRAEIANAVGSGRQFVDLGAGDCRKAEPWLAALQPRRYVAVDIAAAALAPALARIAADQPDLETIGVLADFTAGLDLRRDLLDAPALFFYPGSSIGNFSPADAVHFLRSLREHCAFTGEGSGLLIGVDTKKEKMTLDAAYDDALGVTAAFNRNVLKHVNAILGSDFDPRQFLHRGFYNTDAGRIEMHLEATSAQSVHIDGIARIFTAGERIATEHSYKYTPAEFRALLERAGFAHSRCWQDDAGAFAVFHAA